MAMEDLLKALLGGSAGQASGDASAEDPLAALLGNTSDGGAPQDAGAAQLPADLGGLLGALMGGGASPDAGTALGGSADLSGLLGALIGGGTQAGGVSSSQDTGMPGGIESFLGAAAGGSQPMMGGIGQLLAPFIEGLVEKIGLPSEIAQVVVVFVLNKLLGGLTGGGSGGGSVAPGMAQEAQASGLAGLGQHGLLAQLNSGQGVDASYLRSSGLAQELATQTGLDRKTATRSLQAVFGMLGDQMSGGGQV